MDLFNSRVQHKVFGAGKISDLKDNIVSVRFGLDVKKFTYPDVFRQYLMMTDEEGKQYVDGILNEIDKDMLTSCDENDSEDNRLIWGVFRLTMILSVLTAATGLYRPMINIESFLSRAKAKPYCFGLLSTTAQISSCRTGVQQSLKTFQISRWRVY